MKTRGRKTMKPKRRSKPTAARGCGSSAADLQEQLDLRTPELAEALEQQTATSEVLRVISSSPGELEPVFQSMLASAIRICEAKFGVLFRYDGGAFHMAASLGVPTAYAEYLRPRAHLVSEHPHNPLTRVARTKEVLHIPDITADQAYIERNPRIVALVELVGARTFVAVPMLKEDELIGAIVIYRQDVRPFTDKQIEPSRSVRSAMPKRAILRSIRRNPKARGSAGRTKFTAADGPDQRRASLTYAYRQAGIYAGRFLKWDAAETPAGVTWTAFANRTAYFGEPHE